jgi:hypothetical protein
LILLFLPVSANTYRDGRSGRLFTPHALLFTP